MLLGVIIAFCAGTFAAFKCIEKEDAYYHELGCFDF